MDTKPHNTITDSRGEVKNDLFLEVLRSFGEAKLAVTGASMLPAIWPGDVLEVRQQSMGEVLPGHIVLFGREGRLFAHRVVEKTGRQDRAFLVTRGDCLGKPDPPVCPEELLGRVTTIVRGNRRIVPRLTCWGRVASWLLRRSDFCTRVLMHFSGISRRLPPHPAPRGGATLSPKESV